MKPIRLLFILSVLVALFYRCNVGYAQEVDFDRLVPCIIEIESGGDPFAVSPAGAIGLMQITPIILNEEGYWWKKTGIEKRRAKIQSSKTNRQIDVEILKKVGTPKEAGIELKDLFDPAINVEIGTWYLKRLWNHYLPHYKLEQNLDNLLACYNFGVGNVSKGKKYPKETINYIRKVKRLYNDPQFIPKTI